ncbi:MAG: TIGR00300 family protein [Phycisphaerae bacterium]|jgi:lysine-ketoglutarate reductase/saccharopine dehydrogenase-like protein (TIGR00300 family)|nr:TIGR00300 family protein [Phycisphaerae bacterium]MCZ2399604.1 TIGR00300 family protein [Phycisphaerae bacterium]NUQ49067.1 TIGR00300 family protein [Phycisphaerae bacterium]
MVAEVVTLEGHIIDSKVLATVLDDIVSFGAEFTILEVHIGQSRNERSHARIEVRAQTLDQMRELLAVMSKHGALWHEAEDVEIVSADMDGAFPEAFYSTTNQQTFVRHGGQWIEVRDQEMDCGIVHDPAGGAFRCVPISKVRRGDRVVCGQRGIKVIPFERQRAKGVFEFMASDVSTEKPKNTIIRNCAQLMVQTRRAGKRLLLVGGPAIVHTGAVEHVVTLIERGYVNVLFAGNALATHDIEHSLYGTSLGVYLDRNSLADAGHEHHLRAINTIRRAGGIRQAVEKGVLTGGIMHACVRHGVEVVLAGSVRDDGPLPDVITDALVAQDRMREGIRDVGFVLMVATLLHAIATGNILPAWIPAVCVDISPSAVTKLADRGSFQTVGLVTDVEPFFRSLVREIGAAEASG